MKYEYSFISEQGGRAENQDQYGQFITPDGGSACFVVADGLGGHSGGQIAAGIVVGTVLEDFVHADLNDVPLFLANTIAHVNAAICEEQKKDREKSQMRSTCAVLVIHKGFAWWAHVGDTRIYHYLNGTLVERTKDHSVVQMMVDMGEITPDQMRGHADRNRILKSMGNPESCAPSIHAEPVPITSATAFVLCTDGFWENIGDNEMGRLIRRSANAKAAMNACEKVVASKLTANSDNYTAQIIRFPGAPKPKLLPKPREIQARLRRMGLDNKSIMISAITVVATLLLVLFSVVGVRAFLKNMRSESGDAMVAIQTEPVQEPMDEEALLVYAPDEYNQYLMKRDAADRNRQLDPQQSEKLLEEANSLMGKARQAAGERKERLASEKRMLDEARNHALESRRYADSEHVREHEREKWEEAETTLARAEEQERQAEKQKPVERIATLMKATDSYRQAAYQYNETGEDAKARQTQYIANLLNRAEDLLRRDHLTTGPNGAAYEQYREVLRYDPNNPEALSGIQKIIDRYAQLARESFSKGNVKGAQEMLDAAAGIPEGDHTALEPLRQQVNNSLRAEREKQIQKQSAKEMVEAGKAAQAAKDRARKAGADTVDVGQALSWWNKGVSMLDYGQTMEATDPQQAIAHYKSATAAFNTAVAQVEAIKINQENVKSEAFDWLNGPFMAASRILEGAGVIEDAATAEAEFKRATTAHENARAEVNRRLEELKKAKAAATDSRAAVERAGDSYPEFWKKANAQGLEANRSERNKELDNAINSYWTAHRWYSLIASKKRADNNKQQAEALYGSPIHQGLQQANKKYVDAMNESYRNPEQAARLFDEAFTAYDDAINVYLPTQQEQSTVAPIVDSGVDMDDIQSESSPSPPLHEPAAGNDGPATYPRQAPDSADLQSSSESSATINQRETYPRANEIRGIESPNLLSPDGRQRR